VTELQHIVEWILEAGLLKRTPRSGWSLAGVSDAESVADHSFRCAVIGYVLAHMEGADVYRTLLMTLFNDIHETRITDLHKMAQHYVDTKAAEDRSFSDQIRGLPEGIRGELSATRSEYKLQETKESVVARDADILECLIQAKEYSEHGNKGAALLMKNADHLETGSARKLWALMERTDVNEWWSRIGTFER
jgi:putative hydrolase of HD superfamily